MSCEYFIFGDGQLAYSQLSPATIATIIKTYIPIARDDLFKRLSLLTLWATAKLWFRSRNRHGRGFLCAHGAQSAPFGSILKCVFFGGEAAEATH